jgi:hypothetical protein
VASTAICLPYLVQGLKPGCRWSSLGPWPRSLPQATSLLNRDLFRHPCPSQRLRYWEGVFLGGVFP